MSAIDIETDAVELVESSTNAAGSLADRVAARRSQLQADRSCVIPVDGYEDLGIYARYRILPFEMLRKIGRRHEKVKNEDEQEILAAADTLVTACETLLEKRGDEFIDLGCKWTPATAQSLFGVTGLPEGATARQALREVLPSMQLMLHFNAYDAEFSTVTSEVDQEMAGESGARSQRA